MSLFAFLVAALLRRLALMLLAVVRQFIGLILVICGHQALQRCVLAIQVLVALKVATLKVQVSRDICYNCTIA